MLYTQVKHNRTRIYTRLYIFIYLYGLDAHKKINSIIEVLFPYDEKEKLDFKTFRKRALTVPEQVQQLLQLLLRDRIGLSLHEFMHNH